MAGVGGRLILTGNNTYSGTTTISAGTMDVGAGGTTGTLGTGNVMNNRSLSFNRSDSITVANVISGTGRLIQAGGGTTTLTGANTYTGSTSITAGTLALGAGGSIASTLEVVVSGGGKLHAVSGVVLNLDELGVWAAVRAEHKTEEAGYDRVLFFGPKACEVLRPLIDGQPATATVFRPTDGREQWVAKMTARWQPGGAGSRKKRKGAKGKRRPGGIYHRTVLLNRLDAACRAAGVPKFTPYQIRHQVAKAVQQRWQRDAARVFLGHKVGGATEGYAGTDLTAAARVALAWG